MENNVFWLRVYWKKILRYVPVGLKFYAIHLLRENCILRQVLKQKIHLLLILKLIKAKQKLPILKKRKL